MEDDVGASGDDLFGRAWRGQVASDGIYLDRGVFSRRGLDDIKEVDLLDFPAVDCAVLQQSLSQFLANHPCATND
jgi:hypothetical protein